MGREMPTTQRSEGHRAARRPGLRVSSKLVIAVLIVAAAVWFIVVNKSRVDIYLWVPKITAPMWLVLLLTFAGGLLVGLLLRRNGRPEHVRQH
jgi:uncharacterized integral membrane protein